MWYKKDNSTLTFLLGYLSPEQWASALKDNDTDNELIKELIKIQEEVYDFDLMGNVEANL